MADAEDTITDEEKIRIVSNFILHSPPGEFNEVFNDVRVIINNDFLLKEGALGAFAQYNKDQLTPVKIDGSNFLALITDYNDLGAGRFYDPRSQQSFKYDHLRKEAMEFKVWQPDRMSEKWRKALEDICTIYVQDHYRHATCSVFSNSVDHNINLIACIEDDQFQPEKFWNGRWRSTWSVTFDPSSDTAVLEGLIKVQAHYFGDSNSQPIPSKSLKECLAIGMAISENYQTMSDTTFKALRRLLPVTKIDWAKILSYKIGTELKHH